MQALIALLQNSGIPEFGVGVGAGGLAALMFYFYRQDRAANEKRLGEIITDFRGIIEANTKAMTALTDRLETRTIQCPMVAQQEAAAARKVV